jgi:hypothetical protein
MLKLHYQRLMHGDEEAQARARSFGERVHELVSFLVDVRGVSSVPGSFSGRVTYHDGCSGLRELKIRQQPRALLAAVPGLELVEMHGTDACCGFGGLFSVKFPDISNAMVAAKVANAAAVAPDLVLAGDLGCLMNVAGKLARQGSAIGCRHVAEVLAGEMTEPPSPTLRREAHRDGHHGLRGGCRCGARQSILQRALADVPAGFVAARARAKAALPEFEALRRTGRDIRDHTLTHLDFYLEAFEANATSAGSVVHWAATGAEACDIILGICRDAGARVVTKASRWSRGDRIA